MSIFEELLAKVNENCRNIPVYRPVSGYNLFNVMGIQGKEVLMCRVLADLLNPEGQHGQGILFLKSFLADVLKQGDRNDILLEHTTVETEYVIGNDRRIDIMIYNSQFAIPIEVKIYAGEQEAQCYDYYEYAKNSPIVYLTRYGSEPSALSRMEKDGSDSLSTDQILCISWKDDIYS